MDDHTPLITQDREQWSKVPHWLLAAVKPTAVVVYAQLAAYAWMRDGARPAVARVAKELNMSESTVERALRDLVDAGAVTVQARYGDDEQRVRLPSRYHLHLTRRGVTPAPPGVTSDARPGVTGDTPLASPVTEEEDPLEEDGSRKTTPDRDVIPAGPSFDEFWAVYPRKAGKKDAQKAWTQVRQYAHAILVGARAYRDDPNRDPQFTAFPASWLRAGRWEDDPLPPRSTGRPTAQEVHRAELHANVLSDVQWAMGQQSQAQVERPRW